MVESYYFLSVAFRNQNLFLSHYVSNLLLPLVTQTMDQLGWRDVVQDGWQASMFVLSLYLLNNWKAYVF